MNYDNNEDASGLKIDPEYLDEEASTLDAANEEIARAKHEKEAAEKELAELPEGADGAEDLRNQLERSKGVIVDAEIRRDATRQRIERHVGPVRAALARLLRDRADGRADMLRKMLGVLFRDPAARDAALAIHGIDGFIERCDGVGECRELAAKIEQCRVDGTPGLSELSHLITVGLTMAREDTVAEVKPLGENGNG